MLRLLFAMTVCIAMVADCLGNDGAKPLFRAGLLSDTHINNETESCRLVKLAMELFKREAVEVVIHLGDLADFHAVNGYQEYRRILDKTFGGRDPVFLYAYGGHDGGSYKQRPGDKSRHNGAFCEMREILGFHHEDYDVIAVKGQPFVVFPEYEDVVRVEALFEQVKDKFPDKTPIVLAHDPAKDTIHNSTSWGNYNVRTICERHPGVVHLSGHTHGSNRNELQIWQGAFTEVNCGCLYRWGGGSLAGVNVRELGKRDDGVMVMDVYSDALVFHRFSLETGCEYRPLEPWKVALPTDPKNTPYAPLVRRSRSKPPEWPTNAQVSIDWIENAKRFREGYEVRVPAAMHRDGTYLYQFALYANDGNGSWTLRTRKDGFGEFYVVPEENRKGFAEQYFSTGFFAPGEKLRFVVTPFDFYGNAGKPLVRDIVAAVYAKRPTVIWESANPNVDCVLEFNSWGVGRKPVARGDDGFFPLAAMSDLLLPENASIPMEDLPNTRYRLTIDMRTVHKSLTGDWQLEPINRKTKAPLYAGMYITPRGDSGLFRYVFEFQKYRREAMPISVAFTYGSSGGKVSFSSVKLERLQN